MVRHLTLFCLLNSILFLLSGPVRGKIFTDSGLVDIPTGKVLKHGIFGAGVTAFFQNSSDFPRDAVAFRLNFGMFNRVEFGVSNLLLQDENYSRYAFAHLKAQLLTESELIPNVAIGVENLGDKVSNKWKTYQPESTFLVISKTFNLPRIHLISGHIGIGNHRFAFNERPIGIFAGVSMTFHPAFARGDIALSLEYDGDGVNAGVRHIADSGLQVALGVETLNKTEEICYLLSISWSNAQIMEQIDGAKRLARQGRETRKSSKTAHQRKMKKRQNSRHTFCMTVFNSD